MRKTLRKLERAAGLGNPARIVSASEQCRYWTMMHTVYGSKDDPEPKLEDFRDMPESEFLKPLFEIVDRVYAEPMPPCAEPVAK